MDNPAAVETSRSSLIRLWPWLVVLLVVLFVGFIRFRLLDMPLERDEGEYAYAGQLILQGIPPYELAYNMKLPGTYYGCALGMELFGQTIAGIHATLIVVNSLTIVFVFLLGRKLFGVLPGLVASASYAIMSISPSVLGMAAHATQFVVLFAVPATLLLWNSCESGRRKLCFFSGLLYGLSFLMKQQGVFFCAFGGAYLVWMGVRQRNFTGTINTILMYGAGVFLPFLCLCMLMAWDGVFSRFWFWTYTYAHSYVAIISLSQGLHWLLQHLTLDIPVAFGFWLLGLTGFCCGLFDKTLRQQTLFVAALLGFAFLGTATGLYFRAHYFILVLPAFSILIGLAVEAFPKKLPAWVPVGIGKTVSVGIFAAFFCWCVFFEREYFFLMPGADLIRTIYHGHPFVESMLVADHIREHSTPDARIAVIGSEPEIYFYSQRHSATGYIYIYALNEPQPNAGAMQLDMINEIEAAKPEYIVWVGFASSWLLWPTSDTTISDWAAQYLSKYYTKTGLVNATPQGLTVFLWDEDATNYHGPVGEHIAVYQRQKSAGIPPKLN
jgi:hypothetical protein